MKFDEFLSGAWKDHASQAELVAKRTPDGIALIEKNEQIPPMAQLITHVLGEHLGQWESGVRLLARLRELPSFDPESESAGAIARAILSLELAAGKNPPMSGVPTSDQIRALAMAASALSGQGKTEAAQILFAQALERAEHGINQLDPTNRSLAVTGNNLACSLEEKTDRTPAETELMTLAAQTARKYWEIAGTWLEVERAEYRLSQTYLKAGELALAHEHARACLSIVENNQAPALEFFFAYEALTLAEKALGNRKAWAAALEKAAEYFQKLTPDDRSWCQKTLGKLSAQDHL